MEVLITGGAGYIGSHVANGLLDLNHKVFIIDNLSTGHEILIPNFNYIASANSILMSGATPHFVDIEEKTLGIYVRKLD